MKNKQIITDDKKKRKDYRSVEMIIPRQHGSPSGLPPTKTEVANLRLAIRMVVKFFYRAMQTYGLPLLIKTICYRLFIFYHLTSLTSVIL
ncbi:MAG: hypothetical protein LBT27_01560 [Prevotellaceae bacterium]|nr:hypothetical protein [Prevotellaceae bacterium]